MEQSLAQAARALEESKVLLEQTKASIERCEAQNQKDTVKVIEYHSIVHGKVKLPVH